MLNRSRKYALILCALVTCQQTIGMGAYVQNIFKQATATTGRKIALALVASLICYELYRTLTLAAQRSALENRQFAEDSVNQNPQADHTTLFAHGLGGSSYCGSSYQRYLRLREKEFHAFNFIDAGSVRKCALAQEKDIQQLKDQIDNQKDKNIVLLGLSRGASTAITTMGAHKPKNVKALILESPFDDMRSVVAHKASYARWIPGVTALGNLGVSCFFPNYSTCALRPIDLVTHIPDDVPTLFICSKKDALVPAWSTKKLYTKLKEHREKRGIKNVYLMETEQGQHANILGRNLYQYNAAVHAFHTKVGLPKPARYPGYPGPEINGEEFLTQP